MHVVTGQSLSAEYVLSAPTFDGDSIWNVFGSQAFNDVRLGWDAPIRRLRVYARAFARLFANEITSRFIGVGGAADGGIDPSKVNVGVATRDMVFNAFKEFIRGAGETPMRECWQVGASRD